MSIWGRDDASGHDHWHNPHRLYRDTENARVAGVCAGISDYFGVRRSMVRLAAVLGLIFFFLPTFIAYIALTLILPKRPARLYASREEEVFWRGVSAAPDETLKALRHKFAELEQRLAGMETGVTSPDFDLHRKFRDIGG
jgi:phage shock protein C